MSLVFEDELYDMTGTAKEVLLSDDLGFQYEGSAIFEEFPYYGCRTDLVTVRYDTWSLARRKRNLGHLEPLPDARRYRHSYSKLQNLEPVSRNYWIDEDNTYATEQTCREVWDWFVEYGYLRECDPAEVGDPNIGQQTLAGGTAPQDAPYVTVKFPISITANAWELKPRDWQTALQQAKRADCYVDYRWVVMDAGGFELTHEIRKQFLDAGVGLASLDSDGLDIHAHPDRVQAPRTRPRMMLNERALLELPEPVREDAEEKFLELVEGGSDP